MPLFNRSTWKKVAQAYFYKNHPEYVPLFSSKVVDACCHYMSGYETAIEENTAQPQNMADMKDAVSDAGIRYAIKMIKAQLE